MGATGGAIILIKERQVAEAFERAGVTNTDHARDPQEIGVGMHGIGWRRLVDRAVVREAAPGKWYIDMPSWIALRRQRRRVSAILILLVLAVAAYLLLGQHRP